MGLSGGGFPYKERSPTTPDLLPINDHLELLLIVFHRSIFA